jgi:hypothetical protein
VRLPKEGVVDHMTNGWIKNNMAFQHYDVIPFVKYIEPEPPLSNLYSLRTGKQYNLPMDYNHIPNWKYVTSHPILFRSTPLVYVYTYAYKSLQQWGVTENAQVFPGGFTAFDLLHTCTYKFLQQWGVTENTQVFPQEIYCIQLLCTM